MFGEHRVCGFRKEGSGLSKHWRYLVPAIILGIAVCSLLLGKYYPDTLATTLLSSEARGAIHNRVIETTIDEEAPAVEVPPAPAPRPLAASLTILMYHEIGTGPNSLYLPESNFRAQMAYLRDSGYQVITMAQAQPLLAQNQIPAKTVVITFDDGYVSFYNRVWPILKEFGFPATVYVCTDFADTNSNYLNWQQIIALHQAGIEIASHTATHPSLVNCSPGQLSKEIQGSKAMLESKLGVPVKSFCYPTGASNSQVVQLTKEAGYTSAVTVVARQAAAKDDPYLLPRIRVPGWASLTVFANSLKS